MCACAAPIAAAIDRKAIIDGASNGLGVPIGSHYTPNDPFYVDLTGVSPYDPAKAKALLREAGVRLPLTLRLISAAAALCAPGRGRSSPPSWRRSASRRASSRSNGRSGSMASTNARTTTSPSSAMSSRATSRSTPIPTTIFQYDSKDFRAIMDKVDASTDEAERGRWLEAAQRRLADDAVNGFLYVLPQVTVAKKGLVGLWRNSPIFANDLAAVSWQ